MAVDFFRELADQVTYELEACIGCSLCMRACPLPDAEFIQIGELNESISGVMTQRALRFTLDCTQCGACVPVCPANLSRMRMVLSAKLQIEEQPGTTPVYIEEGQGSIRSDWTIGSLAAELNKYPIFAGLNERQLRNLVPRVKLQRFLPGSTIIKEEEYSNNLHLLLSGAADTSVAVAGGRRLPLLRLAPGGFFGEYGVLSDRPNPSTVVIAMDSIVMTISASVVRRLMEEAPQFAAQVEMFHARWELGAYLRRIDLFQSLPDDALDKVIQLAAVRTYERDARIATEGEPPELVHLVLNGFMKVSRRLSDGAERVLTYLRDGSYYAEGAILSNQPRWASLSANTRCEIVELPRSEFMSLLDQNPAVREAFTRSMSRQFEAAKRAVAESPLPGTAQLATLLEEGVLQSHSLLLIDKRLCIDCDNCVDACVRRHGHPRLERRGQVVGPYLVATACRHCDDPLCLVCPVDALGRTAQGEIVVNDNCIGCGACAARCPYDNIRMADKEQMLSSIEARGSVWTMLQNFVKPRQRGSITFEQDDLRPKVAVKCDLCAGYQDGPACVSNCPTGAAFRADGALFFGSGEQIAASTSISRRRFI